MKYIQGIDRKQTYLFPISLEASISEDNEVRFIDLFVDSLDLGKLGFKTEFKENGRPAYHPSDLLKLYIYGYLNRIRSSRNLERECTRNIEVMWLLKSLTPDFRTIANFRKDNGAAIKKVFRQSVEIAKHFELIGGILIAGDSTKLRAQNSKKNNYNLKKVERHLAYIDRKLEEYDQALSTEDDEQNKEKIEQQIQKQQERKKQYEKIDQKLKESGDKQLSTSDPESRQMIIRNNITEVAYNVQATVDGQHNIPIDYQVTNQNDSKAMGAMMRRAKSIVRKTGFTALFDKGYHTGSELHIAQQLGIRTLVAVPGIPRSSQSPDPAYNVEHFQYCEQTDSYICHEGHKLTTNGTWYTGNNYKFQQYKTTACKHCAVKQLCTRARNGKLIQRSEYTQAIERNREWITQNADLYKQRQAIVEHPFGTIKRQWGYSYVLTKKGRHRASVDVGLMFIAYNLRRLLTIVGKDKLMKYLSAILASFLAFLLLQGLKRPHSNQKSDCRNKKSIFGNIGRFPKDFGLIHQVKLGF